MKKIRSQIFLVICMFCLFSCHIERTGKIVLYQPSDILLDTSLCYFPIITKYMLKINERDNVNQFILGIYNNDENLHLKITAVINQEAFKPHIPNYYFKYKNNIIFVFTGVDNISVLNSDYIKKIEEQFNNNIKVVIYDPGCWEITFAEDTCYYHGSNYPFFPIGEGPNFSDSSFIKQIKK